MTRALKLCQIPDRSITFSQIFSGSRKHIYGLKPKPALRDARRMNPDPESTQNGLTLELKQLEASLHQLKLDYEQYFLGQRPTEPTTQRSELARKLLRPGREPIRNTAARFALNVLKDRFQSFAENFFDRNCSINIAYVFCFENVRGNF